ncbi:MULTISPECIES: peptide-methionine (S)-S-oxide reductase MsrA [Subtercola]|uniref:Peptide methionine sulfoxide reductase MsrA n=1 Tax=Subtercola vilae TaxID=2056433 RepID=A0A4T2C2V0_9MICO|nr:MULTISPECIES: peptide-methionine (S)-S-oxide reductase MsrA [Subtercola]MEA9986210.1 peptide-methionine (S)-S-oxide reductase MsrA [Subtercola sp. RTI3]TIH38327.1 peptide-methionine (S)-S-oxide reductase [Subtercola vilae]
MQTFVLAGGCFWCLDAVYRTLHGVTDVVSGYTGGSNPDPTYEQVCTGRTGHAEVVAVTFDPGVIPAHVILDVFFTLHDPRQLNRQGNDVGTQYRSAMFFTSAEQKELFEESVERAADLWEGDIVTVVEPLAEFYPAEAYHQDFFAKNPGQGYCMAVALPKVAKVRKAYAPYVRAA